MVDNGQVQGSVISSSLNSHSILREHISNDIECIADIKFYNLILGSMIDRVFSDEFEGPISTVFFENSEDAFG